MSVNGAIPVFERNLPKLLAELRSFGGVVKLREITGEGMRGASLVSAVGLHVDIDDHRSVVDCGTIGFHPFGEGINMVERTSIVYCGNPLGRDENVINGVPSSRAFPGVSSLLPP